MRYANVVAGAAVGFALGVSVSYHNEIVRWGKEISGFGKCANQGIEQFCGKYIGFAPIDKSAKTSGELEMVIGKYHIETRFANGTTIEQKKISTDSFKQITPEDLRQVYSWIREANRKTIFRGVDRYLIFSKEKEVEGYALEIKPMNVLEDSMQATYLVSALPSNREMMGQVMSKAEKDRLARLQFKGKFKQD